MKQILKQRTYLILISAICAFHCVENPLEVVMPASDITINNISLFNTTKTISDLVKLDTSLHTKDGCYYYTTTQTLRPVTSFFNLSLIPASLENTFMVGEFSLNGMDTISQTLPSSGVGLPPGNYPYYEQTSMRLPAYTFQFASQIDYAAIRTGALTLTVRNRLPLAISFNTPIIIRNNQGIDQSIIGEYALSQIPPNSCITQTIPLNDKIIRSTIRIDEVACTILNQDSPFSVDLDDGIDYQISSTQLTVDSANAVIPEQSNIIFQNANYILDSTVSLREAACTNGLLHIAFKNNSNVAMTVEGQISELRNITSNQSYDYSLTIQGQDSVMLPLSLDQWKIVTNTGTMGTVLTFSTNAHILGSGGKFVPLSRQDNITVAIRTINPIQLKSVRGKIDSHRISVSSSAKSNMNLKIAESYSGTMNFKGIQLRMNLQSTRLKCPADYHLALIAKTTKTNRRDSLIIATENGLPRIYFDPALNNGSAAITISDVPGFDSFLSQFFPNPPDTFMVQGTITINPTDEFQKPDNECTIEETSELHPSFDLDFPVSFSLSNGSILEKFPITADSKISNGSNGSVGEGTVTLNITNRIPVQMNFELIFLGRYSEHPAGDTMLVEHSDIPIAAAGLSADGFALTPTNTKVTLPFNAIQLADFNASDSVCIRLTNVETPGTATIVHFNPADYIRMSALCNFTYTMNHQ